MPEHTNKTCPRCSAVFECKAGDISKCQCYPVQLNDAEREYLSLHYHDCLCASCMKAVSAVYHRRKRKYG